MVIPIIFAVLYAFATYEFVLVGTSDKLVAGWAMMFAPLSYFIVRISFDLYNNFLGLIVVLLFLTFLMKSIKNTNKRNTLFACILFLVLIFVHVWSWAVFLVILIFSIYSIFKKGKRTLVRILQL